MFCRVIIKVPQRTRHIHHHNVKKVPVYIILPDKKPKVLENLENLTKQTESIPCKDEVYTSTRNDRPSEYRYTRFSNLEKNYEPTENRNNKEIYLPTDEYKTIDQDFLSPPLLNDEQSSFRRTNIPQDNNYNYEYAQNGQLYKYNNAPRYEPTKLTSNSYRAAYESSVSFTYAPNRDTENFGTQGSILYRNRINQRIDNKASIKR